MTSQELKNIITDLRNVRDVCSRQARGSFLTESDAVTALAQIEKLSEIVEGLVQHVRQNKDIEWDDREGWTLHGNYRIEYTRSGFYNVKYRKHLVGATWTSFGTATSVDSAKLVAQQHNALTEKP